MVLTEKLDGSNRVIRVVEDNNFVFLINFVSFRVFRNRNIFTPPFFLGKHKTPSSVVVVYGIFPPFDSTVI